MHPPGQPIFFGEPVSSEKEMGWIYDVFANQLKGVSVMTVREFMQHLILNCEMNDEVVMEIRLPNDVKPGAFFRMCPTHASRIGIEDGADYTEAFISCKPYKELD